MSNSEIDLNANNIEVPEDKKAGVYANGISVTVTETEVIIDFLYVHPKNKPPALLLERVTLSKLMAEKLLESINGGINQFKKIKKGL